jgi:amino acid adenylation domain-containing protein
MFTWRLACVAAVTLTDLQVQPSEVDTGTAECDLTLAIRDHADGLHAVFTYNTALFDAATIVRMAGHLRTLLAGIALDPQQTIARLPLLTEGERTQLLVAWNQTPPVPTAGWLRHERFAMQAEQTPEAVAVVDGQETLTYGELNRRANQVAHYLQAMGVAPEVLVGLYLERSIELVVGFWGILKSGGACVPLDPTYPPERLTFMLEDSQAPIILTQQRLLAHLPRLPHQPQMVCLDTDWHCIAPASTAPLASGVVSGNLSSVFYTSGSTGQPKAVMWQHVQEVAQQIRTQATDQLSAADRHLLKSPIGFTLLIREIVWPLLSGAQLIIVPPGKEQDSAYLVRLMAEQQISVLNLVPSMLHMLLETPGIEACTRLKQVVCFGEPLSAALQDRLEACLQVDLIVYYGVTEAPSATSWHRQHGDTRRIVNIGRRLPNKQVFVLDVHLQPLPIGVPGEMYIGGNLSRGYWHRPDASAERFLPNPYSDIPGARMYRTGDLARYLADGTLEFLGRRDHQVKIRGMRVELGEIEGVLSRHPAVQESVVALWPHAADERLVAYVVLRHGQELTTQALRRFLRQTLPPYMVPSTVVWLEALPLTPHGKVDRMALPQPDLTHPERPEPFVAPRTPVEERLATIWAEMLGLKRISIHDSFFDLGGHSLIATRMLARVRDVFQVELPLRSLFEQPTLAQCALAIIQHQLDRSEHADIMRLLDEVEGLSETDVQRGVEDETNTAC